MPIWGGSSKTFLIKGRVTSVSISVYSVKICRTVGMPTLLYGLKRLYQPHSGYGSGSSNTKMLLVYVQYLLLDISIDKMAPHLGGILELGLTSLISYNPCC